MQGDGVGLTKDILENIRAEVIAQKDPWYIVIIKK